MRKEVICFDPVEDHLINLYCFPSLSRIFVFYRNNMFFKDLPNKTSYSNIVPRLDRENEGNLLLVLHVDQDRFVQNENRDDSKEIMVGFLRDFNTPESISSNGMKYVTRNRDDEDTEWRLRHLIVRFLFTEKRFSYFCSEKAIFR